MLKNIEYIRPLICKTFFELKEKLNENSSKFSAYEIWIDYLNDLDEEKIINFLEAQNKKIVIVTRRLNLEKVTLNQELRTSFIKASIKNNFLIDCDITQKDEIDLVTEKNSKQLLLSFHNYTETPSDLTLIIDEMDKNKPLIYKLACFCNLEIDALALLKIGLKLKEANKKVIITGMGEKGKLVRLASALWFNEFNFAPVSKEEETAAGQINIDSLNKIVELLK